MSKKHKTLKEAALKAGMNRKTARKYLESGMLPSEYMKDHTWRTRQDPFQEDIKQSHAVDFALNSFMGDWR